MGALQVSIAAPGQRTTFLRNTTIIAERAFVFTRLVSDLPTARFFLP